MWGLCICAFPCCVLWKCAWRRPPGKHFTAASQTAHGSTCSAWTPPASTADLAGLKHQPPSQHTSVSGGLGAVCEVGYFHTESWAKRGFHHGIMFTLFFRSLGNAVHPGRGEVSAFGGIAWDCTFHTVCLDNLLPLQTPRGKPDCLHPSTALTCSCYRMNLELRPTVGASPVCKPGVKRDRGLRN